MSVDDIQKACKLGDINLLQNVIKANPTCLNEVDSKLGWAPLYKSIVYGISESAEALLALGADPNIKNRLGQTPLHQAAENNQLELAKLLLRYKANPNTQQNDGDTPLHLACSKGLLEMAQVLLKSGADPNKLNHVLGRTPLHNACIANSSEIVKELLKFQAWVYCKDKNNLLPVDLTKNLSILKMFDETGSKGKLVEEESNSKDSIYEPESEKAILSSNRFVGQHFSFGEAKKSSLFNWLLSLKLENLFETLQSNGFDDLEMLVEAMRSNTPLNQEILKQIGVEKVGHQLRLLSKLEEQCYLTSRYSLGNDSKTFWCVSASTKALSPQTLLEWLQTIHLEYLYKLFLDAGLDEFEQISCIMNSSFPLTDEILEIGIGIRKIGHRHRILSRLNNDRNPGYYRNNVRFDGAEKVAACESCYIM